MRRATICTASPRASLDRVIGRGVDRWLRESADAGDDGTRAVARLLRRLQSEAQLVFYTHAVNAAREERGALAVNSFWLSGCGRAQPADSRGDARDRRPPCARRSSPTTGRRGPRPGTRLDRGAVARLLAHARAGAATTLTLCGERSAARFELQPRTLWQRLRGAGAKRAAHALLAEL